MSSRWLGSLAVLLAGVFAALPATAQLRPQEPDPLAKIRAAADGQVCSTAETSACAQANPKILAAAMGPSPLESNLHAIEEPEAGPHAPGTYVPDDLAAQRARLAFRDVGVDKVDLEGAPELGRFPESVVAEIRGWEKPNEFVLLGAPLEQDSANGSVPADFACNAAMLIEAARDIVATGARPRRSIRFVLFHGERPAWTKYIEMHRAELDSAVAAVIFDRGCGTVNGFSLGEREELEPAIREALSFTPIQGWDIGHDTPDARVNSASFAFLLEGVPNLVANRAGPPGNPADANLEVLRRNTAVAGILAFGLAEHGPPGPRLSKDEVDVLLERGNLQNK